MVDAARLAPTAAPRRLTDLADATSHRAPGEAAPRILRLAEELPTGRTRVDLVPVRRDGSGRLVAVGLIGTAGTDGEMRWTTIGGAVARGEAIEQAISRCVAEALGSAARAQDSRQTPVALAGLRRPAGRDDQPLESHQRDVEVPLAVEVRGRMEPQGTDSRFAWFLITALPARGEVSAAQWALLADFLDAQGEQGLAARMRQF